MTKLLLREQLRSSQPGDEVRSVARARMLTVLRVLDGMRKATVLQFLYEANLVGGRRDDTEPKEFKAVVDLREADLREADLHGMDLRGVNLCKANLEKANLDRASLYRANLSKTTLCEAIFKNAQADKADMHGADLTGAILEGAILDKAILTFCKVTREQILQAASFEGAELPFDMAEPQSVTAENAPVS